MVKLQYEIMVQVQSSMACRAVVLKEKSIGPSQAILLGSLPGLPGTVVSAVKNVSLDSP